MHERVSALKGNNSGKTNCFRISLEMCRLSFVGVFNNPHNTCLWE